MLLEYQGAGNVFRDLIASGFVPVQTLNTVFRQASASAIITHAHQINRGESPKIAKVRQHFQSLEEREAAADGDPFSFESAPRYEFQVPEQFCHVDLHTLATAECPAEELAAVLKKVHPWSSLYYNLTAADVVRRLYTEWIPKYRGAGCEIQVLSPMIRGRKAGPKSPSASGSSASATA